MRYWLCLSVLALSACHQAPAQSPATSVELTRCVSVPPETGVFVFRLRPDVRQAQDFSGRQERLGTLTVNGTMTALTFERPSMRVELAADGSGRVITDARDVRVTCAPYPGSPH
jgi:hypothetical protein